MFLRCLRYFVVVDCRLAYLFFERGYHAREFDEHVFALGGHEVYLPPELGVLGENFLEDGAVLFAEVGELLREFFVHLIGNRVVGRGLLPGEQHVEFTDDFGLALQYYVCLGGVSRLPAVIVFLVEDTCHNCTSQGGESILYRLIYRRTFCLQNNSTPKNQNCKYNCRKFLQNRANFF